MNVYRCVCACVCVRKGGGCPWMIVSEYKCVCVCVCISGRFPWVFVNGYECVCVCLYVCERVWITDVKPNKIHLYIKTGHMSRQWSKSLDDIVIWLKDPYPRSIALRIEFFYVLVWATNKKRHLKNDSLCRLNQVELCPTDIASVLTHRWDF